MSNEIGTKKLSFNIQGEFITKLTREWFYSGKKSYDEVLEMLMDIMSSPDISEVQKQKICRRCPSWACCLERKYSGWFISS